MIPIPCPPADLAPGRLLILACSATKRPDPGHMPAIYRYDGPLWQTLRVNDPRGSMARVAFLSAHYGFQDSAAPIADDNARLTIDLSKRMIAGGMTTRWPRPPSPRSPDTWGMHPGAENCVDVPIRPCPLPRHRARRRPSLPRRYARIPSQFCPLEGCRRESASDRNQRADRHDEARPQSVARAWCPKQPPLE